MVRVGTPLVALALITGAEAAALVPLALDQRRTLPGQAPPAAPAPAVEELRGTAQAHANARNLPAAIQAYLELLRRAPDDVGALSSLARLQAWTGEYDRAIVLYRDAIAKKPDDPELRSDLGDVLGWAKRFDEAEQRYEEALAIAPQRREALRGLAKIQMLRGDLAGAQSTLQCALTLYPDDADLSRDQARLHTQAGDVGRAVAVLLAAERLRPADVDLKRHLAELYQHQKDFARAVQVWSQVAQMDPESPSAQVALARSYLGLGKLRMAREHAALALRLRPSDQAAGQLVAELDREAGIIPFRSAGEWLEMAAFLALLPVVFFASRRMRRHLWRQKAARVFGMVLVPAFIVLNVGSYFVRGWLAHWVDVRLFEAVTEVVLFLGLGLSFVAVLQSERPVREFSVQVVLALGAHPDDIELGCAGFLLKLKASGARVFGLILTRGEKGGEGDRVAEACRAAEFMGLEGYAVLEFPDAGLGECIPALKVAIEARVKDLKPTLVLTHTAVDVHSDHRAVHAATREAARGVPTVLCYEDVSTPDQFAPNLYVDIGSYVGEHLQACAFHRTQEHRSYMDPKVIEGRAAHRGMQIGARFALAFQAVSMIR